MRWTVLLFLFFTFNQLAFAENNPFAKKTSLNISGDVKWRVTASGATKTSSENKGLFYRLMYDAKQLRLNVLTDKFANKPKKFNQLEVKDVLVDSKRLPLFNWCLNNQSEHSRYLQQGLSVKNDVCVVDGNRGQVTIWLDAATVASLNNADNLTFAIKPYRSVLNINYEMADFSMMQAVLAGKSAPLVIAAKEKPAPPPALEKCWAKPPKNNQTIKAIKAISYTCGDVTAKKQAEAVIEKQLGDARALAEKQQQQRAQALVLKQKKEAETIARQQQLAKEQLLKEQEAVRIQQAEQKTLNNKRVLEQEEVATNAAKQSELGIEITVKMVTMCQKYWDKGEHRCYCQKFIEYAPADIQDGASCK